ncbi:Voltage-gated Ion Channel (VIC) Superfamily [Phytophthora palmivora]|uniref:Voltage-gated Ion Channel (VIC) Superfamily n=1 Tax=Phytophthora palmivora TaxID=4796 RepID=A0A2P4XK19_9STRA|nr:Voltage-gated Ion Channel (VIC) Superfamily [Phytophthora palmivora]
MTRQKKDVVWVDMLLQCTDAQSSFHIQWLTVITVGTIYMALIVPYRNSFDVLERLSPFPIAARALELTCEVLFGWDIWVNWNLKDGLESLELYEKKQREAYHKERLWIDVIAAIPIDHFLSDFYQSPLLCLNRCLKLVNFPHYMREINRKVFEPTNYADYTFTLFVDFVGLVTMAFMIGEMANLYVSFISNEVEFRKNHIAVDLYLERWHITGKLRSRSHAFLSSLWSSHRGVSYQAIFDEIPQVIRTQTIMHIANLPLRVFINKVFRPFATAHPHDRDVEAITRAIAQNLKYEGYPRDECVLVEGSVSKEMYFVVKGYLLSTNGGQSDDAPELHYKKGDFFGEHGLLGYSVGVSTVKTVSACDLLSLSSEDLLEVILSRPLFQTALSIAIEGYRQLSKRARFIRPTSKQDDAKQAEDDWGEVLFRLLNARKKKWLVEALSFTAGDPDELFDEPWTASCLKPGQEVGLITISSPPTCVKVFENLLRLVATRGLLDTKNLHQSATQFQETLPIMTADLSRHHSASTSITEKSDNTKISSSNKLPYLH